MVANVAIQPKIVFPLKILTATVCDRTATGCSNNINLFEFFSQLIIHWVLHNKIWESDSWFRRRLEILNNITYCLSFFSFKGHSAKIKCLQWFISLSRSKSRLCQPAEIVFLSSIALLKRKIWRKTSERTSILIPYYF